VKGIFNKILGQNSKTTEPPTQPLSQDQASAEAYSNPHAEKRQPPQFIVGSAQSIGKQRDHNEDSLFTLTTTLSTYQNSTPFGLYIVADGMGGHQHGEVASDLAVRTLASAIINKIYLPLLNPNTSQPEESIQEIMRAGMQEAHQAIMKQAPGGGTTLTAALILGDRVTFAHIGDSRAYIILGTNERIETITRDHSLVQRLLELGRITPEEAAADSRKNILLRALGQGELSEVDISSMQLPASGNLLLCSDGLWGVVPDEDIYRLVLSTTDPEQACQKLVTAANEAGGPDNITAILVRIPS
jgi:protein phosphatase